MECPKCNAQMEETVMSGVTIDRCSNCHGIWFDTGEAERLKSQWMSEVIDDGDPRVGRDNNHIRDVNCPRCKEAGISRAMVKMNDPTQRHIEFEECPEHGRYYDAGEFVDYKYETVADIFRDVVYDLKRFTRRDVGAVAAE